MDNTFNIISLGRRAILQSQICIWCSKYIGKESYDWGRYVRNGLHFVWFKNSEDAVAIKLKFLNNED